MGLQCLRYVHNVQVLQPIQKVKFIVSAYPFGADMLPLMSAAARTTSWPIAQEQAALSITQSVDSIMLAAHRDSHMALKQPLKALHESA